MTGSKVKSKASFVGVWKCVLFNHLQQGSETSKQVQKRNLFAS